MKIATTTGPILKYTNSPADAVRFCKGSGFKYLDYSFYSGLQETSPYMQDDDRIWKKEVEDALAAADECGIKFVQAHMPPLNPAAPNCDYAPGLRAMNRTLEACGMLGIPITVLHTSFGIIHRYPMSKNDYFSYNKKFVEDMLDHAEKYNVTICIENSCQGNMGDKYFPRLAEELKELANYINHPLIKCCWDTGHAIMDNNFDHAANFKILGDDLRAVHIHDNGIFSDLHLPPYSGALNMDNLVQGLIDIDFKGPFTFEVDNFAGRIIGEGPLRILPNDIQYDLLCVLYKIGKFALDTYGIYEG